MVDLTAKPFHLDEEGVRWVRDTIAGMTEEEKIGQLFVNMGSSRDEAYLADMVNRYHIGAVRYQPGPRPPSAATGPSLRSWTCTATGVTRSSPPGPGAPTSTRRSNCRWST